MLLKDLMLIINPFSKVYIYSQKLEDGEGFKKYFDCEWYKVHGHVYNLEVIDMTLNYFDYCSHLCIEVKEDVSDTTEDVVS